MKKLMFICHGNICRSPMAEYLCKNAVNERGKASEFEIASSAVSYEEIGNPVYPPVKKLLAEMGISCTEKRARRLTEADGEKYDLLICMDDSNLSRAKRIVGEKNAHKCKKLLSFAGEGGDVADPWYTGDFNAAKRDILRGINALLEQL